MTKPITNSKDIRHNKHRPQRALDLKVWELDRIIEPGNNNISKTCQDDQGNKSNSTAQALISTHVDYFGKFHLMNNTPLLRIERVIIESTTNFFKIDFYNLRLYFAILYLEYGCVIRRMKG